jgi:hypothetical protein
MMATLRWLTTQYDWTGLAKRFYLSATWELGALAAVAFGIIMLFVLFHGPIVTDRVSVDTFVPVLWIEIGDLTMGAVLSAFLLSNAFRMYRFIMNDTKAPLSAYITEAKTFALNFLTQKRWRECGEDRSRWQKHFILVTGYLTMMTLVIVFIRWFQVDDSSWHFTSIFGYYATGVLLYMTVEMFRSRLKKEETIHRYSELSDWLFFDSSLLYDAHRHYDAWGSPGWMAHGDICHVCDSPGDRSPDAGDRSSLWEMVSSVVSPVGLIFGCRQREGLHGIYRRY